jgi:hypothetical protein
MAGERTSLTSDAGPTTYGETMTGACPVCGFDGGQLSPPDAAVALRSFPRRYGLALSSPDDDDRTDDVVHRRPTGGGLSGAEHGAFAARGIAEADDAFRAIVYRTDPAIELPPLDAEPPVRGGDRPVPAIVETIRLAGDAMAGAIEQAPHDAWTRTGHAGETAVTSLDVVRLVVHIGVHHLRLAERTMAEVSRQLD